MSAAKQDLLDNAALALEDAGIPWESNNEGIHMKIKGPRGQRIDFWPTTNKWMKVGCKTKFFGLAPLLNEIATWKL